jgi:hypothetical protein
MLARNKFPAHALLLLLLQGCDHPCDGACAGALPEGRRRKGFQLPGETADSPRQRYSSGTQVDVALLHGHFELFTSNNPDQGPLCCVLKHSTCAGAEPGSFNYYVGDPLQCPALHEPAGAQCGHPGGHRTHSRPQLPDGGTGERGFRTLKPLL